MNLVRGLTAMLLVVVAGCDQNPEAVQIRAAGAVTQEIQGGTFDSTSSNVVAILIGAGQGGICSGSLIAPNLVLTAHHCVADSFTTACGSNGFGTPFAANSFRVTMSATAAEAVFNGTAQWPAADNVNWFTANLVALPTTPTNNICGGDMALLRLTANITSVCPLIPRVDSPVALNEAYTAVGFGVTSPTGQTAGRRYTVSGLNVLCEGSCGAGTATSEWVGGTTAARGVCEGDSGGPALDAQRRVLGTVSRGDANSCNQALYESVFGQAAWIKSVAAAAATAGGYPAPGWVTGGPTSINPCTGVDGGTGGGAGGGAGGGGGVTGGGAGGGGGSTGVCNAGTTCVDASGAGDFACLDSAGGVPASAPACSQTVACPGGFSCWQTGTTTYACLQDCMGVAPPLGGGAGGGVATGGGAGGGIGGGGGSSGGSCTNAATSCVDASGMGNYACVDTNSSTGIPAGAPTCGTGTACPANYSCWGTSSGNFCLENCTPGGTGGGGGGTPVGGGAGGGVPVGGGAGGGSPVGGGAGGGTAIGGGAGGGTSTGGGTGTGGGTSTGGGTGTGGSGGAGGSGGSGGAGGGFMFPGLPEQPKKTGCGCTEVPGTAIWLALSGLTLIRRRRR